MSAPVPLGVLVSPHMGYGMGDYRPELRDRQGSPRGPGANDTKRQAAVGDGR